jgi:DNA-directed RNA polymerase
MTALQSVYIADPNATAEVSPTKQASAFPPNFIHSLDATHMLLTAMKCRQNGVTFASVHDSYWTHAGSVDELSKNIRQTFIELHSQDIIGDLRREVSGIEALCISMNHGLIFTRAPSSSRDTRTIVSRCIWQSKLCAT